MFCLLLWIQYLRIFVNYYSLLKQKENQLFAMEHDLLIIIKKAIQNDRRAQKELFDRFAPRLLSVCRQYFADQYQAEDVMLSSFAKIFKHLDAYSQEKSFHAWIHRLTINECIDTLRKNKVVTYMEPTESMIVDNSSHDQFYIEDIQNMIDQLPLGCKVVFNLYVIEGYKHQEIAEILNIDPGTSKSQLAYARKLLKDKIGSHDISTHPNKNIV